MIEVRVFEELATKFVRVEEGVCGMPKSRSGAQVKIFWKLVERVCLVSGALFASAACSTPTATARIPHLVLGSVGAKAWDRSPPHAPSLREREGARSKIDRCSPKTHCIRGPSALYIL